MTFDPSSREAEARAEIDATRFGRGIAISLVAGVLALLASGPALELAAAVRGDSRVFRTLDPAPVPSGDLSRLRLLVGEIEQRLDERSELVRRVRPRVQELLTRYLGYGNQQATIGRDGWLFFRDDLEHVMSRRPGARAEGDPFREILAFRDDLSRRGIALIAVPTPLKPTVYPERLTPSASAPLRRSKERDLLAQLRSAGVEVVDLADRFARDARLAPLYLAADTHWRPEGQEIAAREIALRLRDLVELPPGDASAFEEEPRSIEGAGDTAALLELREDAGLFARETIEIRAVIRRPSADTASPSPVLLLGDSFSAIYGAADLGWGTGAGLAQRLAWYLGLPVDQILRNAGGASSTRELLARECAENPGRLAGVRAVVWQFAARELSQGAWLPTPLDSPPGSK